MNEMKGIGNEVGDMYTAAAIAKAAMTVNTAVLNVDIPRLITS
jgi:hypothetical protein